MLRALAPELAVVDHPQRVGFLDFPTRTTALRVPAGVVLVSPGPLDDADADAISAMGPVVALVAPNKIHHLYLAAAKARFPAARVFAAPGLREKLPGLPIDEVLTDEAPPTWAEAVEQHHVGGCPSMEEVVFFHRATRTLVVTDLAFHFRHVDHTPTRWAMWLNDALGRFGPSRLMRSVVTRDRDALRRSIERILRWDFDRVVVAHGDVLEAGGHDAFRGAFSWLG